MYFAVMLFLTISIVLNVLLINSHRRSAWRKFMTFLGLGEDKSKSKEENAQTARNLILLNIRNMHVDEMVTLRQRFQSVLVDFVESKKIPGTKMSVPGTGRIFVATYEGEITYGNDLSKITISEPIGINQLKITVPHSRILDKYPDFNSLKVIVDSTGFFMNKANLEQQAQKIQADVEKFCEHAIENGILEQADRNTATVLRSLVATTGMDAEILFVDAPEEPEVLADAAATDEKVKEPEVLQLEKAQEQQMQTISETKATEPMAETEVQVQEQNQDTVPCGEQVDNETKALALVTTSEEITTEIAINTIKA